MFLQTYINMLRDKAALTCASPALKQQLMKPDSVLIHGLIRAREVPFEAREEWVKWWLPERNDSGTIIKAARMSQREKERYTVAEKENILVAGGITQVLNYVGSASGNTTGFAKYFAIGNIALSRVTSADTSVAGEYFRAIPSLASISGVQQDISTFMGTGQGNGSITNAGLFGGAASATLGSGTMMTHSLFNYVKLNTVAITADYLLSYS